MPSNLTRNAAVRSISRNFPHDDPENFRNDAEAPTPSACFKSKAARKWPRLPRMKPKCFYDVVIEVAIIRPGPIQGH